MRGASSGQPWRCAVADGNPEAAGVDAVVIGPDHLDAFATNIAAGLRAHGLTTAVVDPRPTATPLGSSRLLVAARAIATEAIQRVEPLQQYVDRRLERELAEADPQLVISVWSALGPEQVERFRRRTPRARWAFWYPDAVSNLGDHRLLLAPYDRFYFKEPHLVDQLAARTSLPVSFLPQAANPDHHRTEQPVDDAEARRYECDVAVAGNLYSYRLLVMEAIPDEATVHIYGNRGRPLPARFDRFERARTGEYVAGRTKALAFVGARIVLNTMHYAEIRGINSRLFEATACGGFVLCHTGAGLGDYFEVGAEVVAVDSSAELADAIHHYLDAPDERSRIARSGQVRAHRDHTYPQRLASLLDAMGCRPPDKGVAG